MAGHDLIPLRDREAWRDALRGLRHGFQQTWEFAHAMQLTTGYETFLYRFVDRGMHLACPLVERPIAGYVDVATPSGLAGFVGTGSWSSFAPHWREFVRARGYVSGYLGLHPLFTPPDFAQHAEPHNSIYALDLTVGGDALLKRMDRSRRRELRGWDTRTGDFVLDRDAVAAFLVEHYEPFMRRVGARDTQLAPATLEFLCRCDSCVVIGAASSGGLDAVYLFSMTPDAGDCLINVATPDGRRRATDLLWFGVKELSARGIPVLNLGGGPREDDNVARAKQRFRPSRLPLRSMRQVYRKETYAELCHSVGRSPAEGVAYFPAYRAPRNHGVVQEPARS